jgi:hypothetical protein
MRVKLAWLVRVGGARPPPFTTITITNNVAVYAPAEWSDTLTLFHLYQYMYLNNMSHGQNINSASGEPEFVAS